MRAISAAKKGYVRLKGSKGSGGGIEFPFRETSLGLPPYAVAALARFTGAETVTVSPIDPNSWKLFSLRINAAVTS
jgi:hypothetical protein